jgi:hypothetical protein
VVVEIAIIVQKQRRLCAHTARLIAMSFIQIPQSRVDSLLSAAITIAGVIFCTYLAVI